MAALEKAQVLQALLIKLRIIEKTSCIGLNPVIASVTGAPGSPTMYIDWVARDGLALDTQKSTAIRWDRRLNDWVLDAIIPEEQITSDQERRAYWLQQNIQSGANPDGGL